MRNLLDTHTFIWFINGSDELSVKARKAIEHKNAINFISIASLWEIGIKISLGKLVLNKPFAAIAEQIEINGFQLLQVSFEHILIVANLPFHHRDPFDRLLVAQGIANNLAIISKDKQFRLYDTDIIW